MKQYVVHVEAKSYGRAYGVAKNKDAAKLIATSKTVVLDGPVYEIEVVGVDEA